MQVDEAVAALARRQYGLFTRAHALALGFTARMVEARLRSGRWEVAAPGVYGLPGAPLSWRRSLMGACLEAGNGAVACHDSAAALHGLAPFVPGPVVVMLEHGDHQYLRLGRLRQATDLRPHHRTVVDGIPVTTVPRTLVDLAGAVRAGRLRCAVEDALTGRSCSLDDLTRIYSEVRRPGKRGMRAMGAVLRSLGPGPARTSSALERRLRRVLAAGGLPEPVREYDAPWSRESGERVDLAYRAARVIVEADSRRWHTRERDFEADRRRDREAQLAGWDVYRFTWLDLVEEADTVVATVRRALDLRRK